MRRALAAVCLFIATISLVGCGAQTGPRTEYDKVDGDVSKVNVDGTECVIFDADGGGGGVDCDWGSTTQP